MNASMVSLQRCFLLNGLAEQMVTVDRAGRNVNIQRTPFALPQDPFPKQTFLSAGNPVAALKSKDEGRGRRGRGEAAQKFKVWFWSPTYSYA